VLKVFDSSEDVDLIDEHDEDYYFYEHVLDGGDEDEDENKEGLFTTTTPRVKHCFKWHNDVACRNGGRAGRCRIEYWTEKCIYCERDEKANMKTGKCVRSGGGDRKVEHCFRWHDDAGCRKGSRAGRCIRNWTEKCIDCEREEEADKMTGECKRSGGDDENKEERCFRWHDSAACRRGGRAGYCIRGWTKKCCKNDEEADKMTGECKRKGMFMEEA
jgi:hypothetical protein